MAECCRYRPHGDRHPQPRLERAADGSDVGFARNANHHDLEYRRDNLRRQPSCALGVEPAPGRSRDIPPRAAVAGLPAMPCPRLDGAASVSPCVSVLMPVYNSQHYVRESVNSVLAQTFSDFELIVVNDGSQDQTADILASIRDSRLRVIHNERNYGIVQSLNRGMQEAHGSYIARIDADDFCLPIRLERQKRFLDAHPNVLLVGSEMFNLEDDSIIHDPRPGELDPLIIRWQFNVANPIGHPSMMFRAGIVRTLGCYLRKKFPICQDLDFSHRVLRIGDIATMPEQLGIYRRHPQSLTHTREREARDETLSIMR